MVWDMNHPSEYLAELYACVCVTARSASMADKQKHCRLKAGSAAARRAPRAAPNTSPPITRRNARRPEAMSSTTLDSAALAASIKEWGRELGFQRQHTSLDFFRSKSQSSQTSRSSIQLHAAIQRYCIS